MGGTEGRVWRARLCLCFRKLSLHILRVSISQGILEVLVCLRVVHMATMMKILSAGAWYCWIRKWTQKCRARVYVVPNRCLMHVDE